MSQVEWLKANSDPDLLHQIIVGWNWDYDAEVLAWALSQPDASFSAASLQIIQFIGNNGPKHEDGETAFMAEVPARLRTGFYKNNWSLEPHNPIGAFDKQIYWKALKNLPDPDFWSVPPESFGPFPEIRPVPSRFAYDERGSIRLAFDVWKAQRS
jgi:hypothetical protein